jgi:hypothetical protein
MGGGHIEEMDGSIEKKKAFRTMCGTQLSSLTLRAYIKALRIPAKQTLLSVI